MWIKYKENLENAEDIYFCRLVIKFIVTMAP